MCFPGEGGMTTTLPDSTDNVIHDEAGLRGSRFLEKPTGKAGPPGGFPGGDGPPGGFPENTGKGLGKKVKGIGKPIKEVKGAQTISQEDYEAMMDGTMHMPETGLFFVIPDDNKFTTPTIFDDLEAEGFKLLPSGILLERKQRVSLFISTEMFENEQGEEDEDSTESEGGGVRRRLFGGWTHTFIERWNKIDRTYTPFKGYSHYNRVYVRSNAYSWNWTCEKSGECFWIFAGRPDIEFHFLQIGVPSGDSFSYGSKTCLDTDQCQVRKSKKLCSRCRIYFGGTNMQVRLYAYAKDGSRSENWFCNDWLSTCKGSGYA